MASWYINSEPPKNRPVLVELKDGQKAIMKEEQTITEKSIDFLENLAGEKLTLGGLLRSIRMGEEMRQLEFAKLLEISEQYLSDIEDRKQFISPKVAEEFALKLGYSTNQFVRLCLQDITGQEQIKCMNCDIDTNLYFGSIPGNKLKTYEFYKCSKCNETYMNSRQMDIYRKLYDIYKE